MNKVDEIKIDDKIYPESLKNISSPPKILYFLGDIDLLSNIKMIGVVGTRSMSSYGKLVCNKIVSGLVESEVTIISGLAVGIDSLAHRVALDLNGETIAVVGSGLDVIYPKLNQKLWEEIRRKGLIISEFPLGTKPYPQHFPMRNRIIVGLSKGIIVIESKEKGGSLITANMAIDENRDVYAVPGDIFNDTSKGCNSLIRESKAKLITNSDELLIDYNWEIKKDISEFPEDELEEFNDLENKVLVCLEYEKTLDEIIKNIGIDIDNSMLLSTLMELEIKSCVKCLPGGKFKKIK